MDIPKEILPIGKAYDDALSPAVKQVGQILENTVKVGRFLLAPIDYLATQQDRWQRYLKRISESVPEENLVEGHPQVVIPAIEGLSLSYEDTLLSELFIKLLSNSIDKTKQDLTHPAFPGIIKQISHDEAVMLYYLAKGPKYYVLSEPTGLAPKLPTFGVESYTNQIFTGSGSDEQDGVLVEESFPVHELQFPEMISLYTEHLSNLGLVEIVLVDTETNWPGKGGSFLYSVFSRRLTEFGMLFSRACIPSEFDFM